MSGTQQITNEQSWWGRALEDLDTTGNGDTTLRVLVPELTPGALTGTFAPGTTKATVTTTNLSGATETSSVTTANHIVATWIGRSNTPYPPAIRQGEQVKIIQYSNSDKYYWEESGRDRPLRQTDRHRIEVGAMGPNPQGKPTLTSSKDDTNTYFLELDSINGVVQIKTSKMNGEPFAYGIRIDTKNGTLLLSDDSNPVPNRILIDSKAKQVQMNNNSGTSLSLMDQDMVFFAPRDILFRAKRQIVTDAPVTTVNKPGSTGAISVNGQSLGLSIIADITAVTNRFGINGATKLNGVVITGPMRSMSYAVGPLGSEYGVITTNIMTGSALPSNNTTDVDTIGEGDRQAAAYEQVNTGFQLIVNYFEQVKGKIGVPADPTPLTTLGAESVMPTLKGT